MEPLTEYRLVSVDEESIRYLQFKSISYYKKYFGLFGEVTLKEVWRYIPSLSKAQNNEWVTERDFPIYLIRGSRPLEDQFINTRMNNLEEFEKAYPNIQSYIEETKRAQADIRLFSRKLTALQDLTFSYGTISIRVRSFSIQKKTVFLINFPFKDPAILVYDDKQAAESPWWSFPDPTWKEKEEIVKLIGNNFGKDQ